MKIESIIKRPKGHEVTLDDGTPEKVTYQFRPENGYIAEVENTDHLQRFLCIREGYRIPKEALAAATAAPQAPATGPATVVVPPKADATEAATTGLLGSSVHPPMFDIGGTQYALGQIVSQAFEASGMTVESWNALDADVRHGLLDDELNRIAGLAEDSATLAPAGDLSPEAMRDELAEEYKELVGKLPPKNWTLDTLRNKIEAAKSGGAE